MPGEGKAGDGKGEGKGGGSRALGEVVTEGDYDTSSNGRRDVDDIAVGETAAVLRSDGKRVVLPRAGPHRGFPFRRWRYAILDERKEEALEFMVGSGEDDYKLFCVEEYGDVRKLDCGGGSASHK